MVAAVEAAEGTRPHAAERLSPRRGVAAATLAAGTSRPRTARCTSRLTGHAVAVPRSYGYGYGGNHYHAPYYGHYPSYGYGYGHAHYAPYYRPYYYGNPYYAFHSHFSIGFGLYLGYPVPYPYSYSYPYPVPYPYPYSVPGSWVSGAVREPVSAAVSGRSTEGQGGQYQDPQGGYPQDQYPQQQQPIRNSSSTGTTSSTRSRRAAR